MVLTSLISLSAFWDFRPALSGGNPKVHCKPCDCSLLVVCAKTETAYLIMTSPPERTVSITTKVMTAGLEARLRGKRSLEAPLSCYILQCCREKGLFSRGLLFKDIQGGKSSKDNSGITVESICECRFHILLSLG